jgi:hypothetical protein
MKIQFLPLATAWLFALVSPAAAGQQPLRLSDAQMDRVTAGAVGSATSLADALGNLQAQTLTFTLGSVDSGNGGAFAAGLSTASASSLLSPAAATSKSSAMARTP